MGGFNGDIYKSRSEPDRKLEASCLPAALGDGLVNGLVDLLVVVVLVSGVLPHVGFERRGVTAHVSTQGAPEREEGGIK